MKYLNVFYWKKLWGTFPPFLKSLIMVVFILGTIFFIVGCFQDRPQEDLYCLPETFAAEGSDI